jgi:hypothetical protein
MTSAHDSSTAGRLFLFSMLTIHFAFASPRKDEGALLFDESGYPDWLFLLQGTQALAQTAGALENGPLSPLFKYGMDCYTAREAKPTTMPHAHGHLESMRSLIIARQQNLQLRSVYTHAIDEMQKTFSAFEVLGSSRYDLTDAMVWVFEMAQDLLPLLRVPTQEAVAIFAFFAVLLKRVENQWWLYGWADHLIGKSYSLLDEEHRLWIQWPLEELGYVPP